MGVSWMHMRDKILDYFFLILCVLTVLSLYSLQTKIKLFILPFVRTTIAFDIFCDGDYRKHFIANKHLCYSSNHWRFTLRLNYSSCELWRTDHSGKYLIMYFKQNWCYSLLFENIFNGIFVYVVLF